MTRRVRTVRKEALLALDVAFANLGWVVFSGGVAIDCGTIKTVKSDKKLKVGAADDRFRRCQEQAEALREVCDDYMVRGVLAELPGGAQDANAAIAFGLAIGTLGAFSQLYNVPVEVVTPNAVKKALCGSGNASKSDMMEAACAEFGGEWVTKPHGKTTRVEYTLCGNTFGAGMFEHIADACGVYRAAKHSNLMKMFG